MSQNILKLAQPPVCLDQ